MSLSLRFLSKVVSTCVFALLTLLTYAVTDCSVGYKPQTNPFSYWSGCGVRDNGFGETSSAANGEWSASFSFDDFITVKGNAYCLNEQYSMPSQRTSCDNYAFPVVENVNTTQTGNVCWCQVTAWQPFTASKDAPFEEVEAKYIQMPVNAVESCTLQSCGNICASIGASNGRSIGLEHTSAGLRAAMYQSVKECVPDDQLTCDEIGYTLQDNECAPITYTITYKDKDNNLITEFVESSVATTYTIESETITLPTPSAPEGMEFVGWYDNAQFSGDAITQIATNSYGNKTLYAKWGEPLVTTYTVYWAPGDHGTGNMTELSNKNYGDTITLPANSFYEEGGYVFDSWDCGDTIGDQVVGATFTMPAANVTCTAKWTTLTYPFSLTTKSLLSNSTFQFYISAAGTFYVDCGTDGALYGIGVSGVKITKNNLEDYPYQCMYSNGGEKTIRFDGKATGYNNTDSTNKEAAAIRFNVSGVTIPSETTAYKITSISGSLGKIFGTVANPRTGSSGQPKFAYTFYGAVGITGTNIPDPNNPGMNYALPPTLFDGIYGAPSSGMFKYTFGECNGLSGSIPSGLFGNLSGAPKKEMFLGTFAHCRNLTGSIPSELFGDLYGAPARNMFSAAFYSCARITGFGNKTYVPGTFLANIATNTSVPQTQGMFFETELDNSCPAGTYNVTREQFSDASKPWCSSSDTLYTVSYLCGDGSGTITNSNSTHAFGLTVTTLTADSCTAPAQKVFAGWSCNQGIGLKAAKEPFTMPAANVTCTAQWNSADCLDGYEYNTATSNCDAVKYSISYVLDGGTNNSNNPSFYTIETPTITLLAPTKSGFDFDGWYDENGNRVTEIATNSYGDKTLTAHWKTAETCAEWEHEQDNPFAANFSGCHTAVAPLSVYRGADGNDGDWYANWMNSNINRFSLVKGKAYCLEANYPLVQGTNLCDYPLPIVENVDTTKTGDHCWCKVTQYNTYSDGEMIDLDSSYIQIPYHYTCNLNYCAQMCSSIGAHSADFYAAQFDYIDGYYWDYANLRASVYRAVKQCVPNKYTITFNTNGGSDIDAITYTYNDLPFELPEPVLANKDFVGWFDGNTKITQITTSNYGDKTLTAHWTEAGACATGEHEQENPLASKWSNCGIIGDYSAGSYGADGENGDWYASFDISDFVHTIRGKAYCVEQIPNTPAETPDNKQGICGSYSFAISETIDTARTGNYCWCQVTEYKTDNNTDFKPLQSAYIGLPTAFTNPSCTPKLCAQACATVGDYSSGQRTNFDNLARRDNVGLRAAMYQSVKQCLPDDQLTCDEIGYTLQDNECTPITYTITYKDKDNNLITEFVETSVATTYTIESETITLPTPSAPEGMEFVGWYYNAQFSGDAVEQIATGSTEDKVLYAKFTETETPDQTSCEPFEHEQTNPFYYNFGGCTTATNVQTSVYRGATGNDGDWFVNWIDNNLGIFSMVKGKAYCLSKDLPREKGENLCTWSLPIAKDVDLTQKGNHCWCQVTQYNVYRDDDLIDIAADYIQIPNPNDCTLTYCANLCASIGARYNDLNYALFAYDSENKLQWNYENLRTSVYRSVKKCVPNEYTITFNVGDGNAVDNRTYTYNELPITLPVPTNNNGKVFVGWYDNAQFSGEAITQIATNSYGNKTLYARWGETETPIVTPESECEPGYYLPQNSDTCAICEENNYCVGGANPIMQSCPTGLVSPTGTISANNCGKIMLVGENVLYLTKVQQTTPALAVKIDGKVYYAKTTPISQIGQPAEHFLRTKIDGVEYSIHDNRF